MNPMIEATIFLTIIALILSGLLYREHHRRMNQWDFFLWMSHTAGFFVFDYDPINDKMHLSPSCASVLHLPESIPAFRTADKQLNTPLEKLGLHFLAQAIQKNDVTQELCLTYTNNRTCFYCVNSHKFYDKNHRKVLRITGFFSDITANTVKEQQLEQKAATDQLTGVYNRGAIHDLIQIALKKGIPSAFIMLDIDYFKTINDSSGHQAGDKVLQDIVQILREHIRHTDIIGRMGGDEFCLYLPNIPSKDYAEKLCERICDTVPSSIHYGTQEHPVTMSVGGTITHPQDTFTSLYSRADNALYQSKRQGRNKVTIDDCGLAPKGHDQKNN